MDEIRVIFMYTFKFNSFEKIAKKFMSHIIRKILEKNSTV